MIKRNGPLVDTIVACARDLVEEGARPEDVINALLGCAHILAERENSEEYLRDLLEVFAEKLENV